MSQAVETLERPSSLNREFADDVLAGLSQTRKAIPSRWLYDEAGSALFEQITDLPEYYPTRTETAILQQQASAIAQTIGPQAVMVEYGAGASVKTRILLNTLQDMAAYVPIDISASFLAETVATLRTDYPDLKIKPIAADFMEPVDLAEAAGQSGRPVGFFPGSTIGNLTDSQIIEFLTTARKTLSPSGRFLIGIDLRKSPDILVPAYDDSAGVTAAFISNILNRVNRELDGNFDLSKFTYRALWADEESQIEMHLVSDIDQQVMVLGQTFDFVPGETIQTSFSRKFRTDNFVQLAQKAGWDREEVWTDAENLFCVMLLKSSG